MRRAARTDANHRAIVLALRAIGASVVDLSDVGRGVPDLLVGFRGQNWLLEVKDGEKSPARQRLTGMQIAFMSAWRGQAAVVKSVDEALAVVAGR